jgi:hypothetical protein
LFKYKAYVNGVVIIVTRGLRANPRVEAIELANAARRLHA